jgi:hypothetical protein
MIVFFLELNCLFYFQWNVLQGLTHQVVLNHVNRARKVLIKLKKENWVVYLARGKNQPMVQALRAKYIVWVSFIYISGFLISVSTS